MHLSSEKKKKLTAAQSEKNPFGAQTTWTAVEEKRQKVGAFVRY